MQQKGATKMTRVEAILYLTPIAESASLERYKEALSMAVAALREQEERRWIPVTERLPDIGIEVLVYSEDDGICVDYYGGDFFGYYGVTHWMPLPEPPKEDKP